MTREKTFANSLEYRKENIKTALGSRKQNFSLEKWVKNLKNQRRESYYH